VKVVVAAAATLVTCRWRWKRKQSPSRVVRRFSPAFEIFTRVPASTAYQKLSCSCA